MCLAKSGWFNFFFLNLSVDTNQWLDRHGFGLRIEDLGEQGLVVPFGLIDDLGVDGHVQGGFAVSLQPIDGLHDRGPFAKNIITIATIVA
jgi:hypothetical protein